MSEVNAGRPVNIAVLGCGSVSSIYHAPALLHLEHAGLIRVAGVFDPDGAALRQIRQQLPSARRMSDAKDLAGVDLAIVASPVSHHAQQTIDALRAGVGVLCEKPMTSSVAEGEAMLTAAAECGGLLAVGLVRRFLPAAQTIRAILANRMLGDIRNVDCFEGGEFRWPVRSPHFFDPAQGGVFLDLGPHMLDLLVWWLGVPQGTEYEDDAMGGVEANCRFVLHYDSGLRVHGRLSRDWGIPNRYHFQCADGWMGWSPMEPGEVEIGLHSVPFTLAAELRENSVCFRRAAAGRKSITFEEAFMMQIINVVDALRGKAPLMANGSAGLTNLRLIDECLRHRKPMQMPWFTETESARARVEAERTE